MWPLAVQISHHIRIDWPLSLLETGRYSTFLLYHLIIHCGDVALTCVAHDGHMPAFACAIYMWLVDGSPQWWTPPVIRTQMALQLLIIDAANMWQLLINTHARWIVQIGTILMIHWKPWGGGKVREREREEGRENITEEYGHIGEMTVRNCFNNMGKYQVGTLEVERYLC